MAKLTGRQEMAAVLVAEDHHTDPEIAAKVGVTARTLCFWKLHPLFATRVGEIEDQLAERALRHGIARKEHRVTVLQATLNRLLAVIEERAADPTMAAIPGGKTGLLVRQYKVSGKTVVAEYAVDTATIRELRAVQEQAAKELGQWVDRHEHRVIHSLRDLTDDELAAIEAETDDSSVTLQGATRTALGDGKSLALGQPQGHDPIPPASPNSAEANTGNQSGPSCR